MFRGICRSVSVAVCLLFLIAMRGSLAWAGEDSPKEMKFDVISIHQVKPGAMGEGVSFDPTPTGYNSNLTIWMMLAIAYAPDDRSWETIPMLNMPDWARSHPPEWYSIRARVSESDQAAWRNQGPRHELLRAAMRDLLKTRCNLSVHKVPAEFTDYTLVVSKKGLRGLKLSDPKEQLPPGGNKLPSGGVQTFEWPQGRTLAHFYGAQIAGLAEFISSLATGTQVHDKTGMTGRYDFTLEKLGDNPTHDRGHEFLSWPVSQLGLELKTGKYEGFKLVIDHIEKPSSND